MSNKIILVEMDKIVHKDKTVAELMSNYFINITKTRNLKSSKNSNRSCDHVNIKKNKRKCSANNPQYQISPVSLGM